MFKQLFVLLFKMIAESTQAWKLLSEKQDKDNEHFYRSYLFPIVGIIALLSFIGVLIDHSFDVHVLQRVLKTVIKQVIIYGGSFYIMSHILSEYVFPRFNLPKDKLHAEQFTGYGSALIYAIAMVKALFPGLFLLEILVFYTIYILWAGAVQFLKINEDQIIKFTIFAGIIILITPFLLDMLIDLLMPGMKTQP
ncbi:MAG: hypothetical protein LBH19_13100 [Dysgonamonadaceae bacterium]|jgi:hypothetical protein|nr:hypothetical protein [Dysgonamonadaceae bacterium]